jgi:cytochrome c oxidase subunit II
MTAARATLGLAGAALVTTALIVRGGATASAAHEIEIVASKFQYEPSIIQVSAGEPVRLVIRSREGTHGFSIPKLHIDVRLAKTGDPVTVEFTAPPPGRYPIACSEFCGSGHGQMTAALVSVASVTTSR